MPIADGELKPDQALAIDCEGLHRRLFPYGFPASYIEGFVVIQSRASLDVTAVCTTAALDREGRAMTHSSIDVERVAERRTGKGTHSDLIPVPDPNGSSCRGRDGQLLVTVKNQRVGPAGASITTIDFDQRGQPSLPTPPLAPGASADLLFAFPAGCFVPDCDFRITVDATNVVVETNEGNNTANDTCIG